MIELSPIDKLIHESGRLVIMTALAACQSADFLYMQSVTGLTKGNLSSHLSKLEEAGLIDIAKQFIGKKPNTVITLTGAGREAIERHWQNLDALRSDARKLRGA